MKIAAGCFGCLALIFLLLTMLTGTLISTIASMDPNIAAELGPFTAYIQYINGSCCCLSGALCIILFAVGVSRGNNEPIE
jgi:hypothetical protein